MIRVFLSHKYEDLEITEKIAEYLERNNAIEVYVDVNDPVLEYGPDDLGDYFRQRLAECTHLMAVVSRETEDSWWVPFEIGIATEKQYPISTFVVEEIDFPDYLKKWPYLRSYEELDKYIIEALTTEPRLLIEGLEKIAADQRGSYSRKFHRNLKKSLGQ